MLTKLKVQNYRSLKDTEVSFGPLTVLIGANGSGKSNILDVLQLVQELVVDGVRTSEAFGKRGGYPEVVWGGDTRSDIAVDLSWAKGQPTDTEPRYACRFNQPDSKDALMIHEGLTIGSGPTIERGKDTFSVMTVGETVQKGGIDLHVSAMHTMPSRYPSLWPSDTVLDSMGQWAFHRFIPAAMRVPQPIRKEYRLDETGRNLSTVIHTLFSDGDPALDEIVDMLRVCVRDVEKLISPIHGDGQTYVALKETSVPQAIGSWGLSDGTLLALAIATALMTPRPPSLIALEAPDIELHPYVMEALAEMLTLASEKTQVIATTHSPYLLDWLPMESFVVVEKTEGATTCTSLESKKELLAAIKGMGPGEAWHAGHLGGVP